MGSVTFLVMVGLITLVLLLANRGGSEEPAQVSKVDNNWKTIDHPAYGISFSTPIGLQVSVLDSGFGSIVGSLMDGNTVLLLNIHRLTDKSIVDLRTLVGSESDWSISEIVKGKVKGIKYAGRQLVDDAHEEDVEAEEYVLSDSYVVGIKLLLGGNVLSAECSVAGPSYADSISICNRVIDSIKLN